MSAPSRTARARQVARANQVRRAVVVAVATIVSLAPLTGLTHDPRIFTHGAGLIVAIVAVGAGLRWAGLRSWVVHLAQVLVLAGVLVAGANTGAYAPGFTGMIRLASRQFHAEAPPLSTTEAARWAMLALIGVLAIVIDVVMSSLRAPAWAVIPLTGMYLIPALTLGTGLPYWQFAALAGAYLALLTTDTITDQQVWTRNVSSDTWRPPLLHWGALRIATWIGVPVLVLSLVLASVAPQLGRAPSLGKRSGTGPIQMADPTIDLAQDLNQPQSRNVLTYSTSTGEGTYLRMATLTTVSASGWRLPSVSLSKGTLPSAPGVTVSTRALTTRVQIGEFDSEYLPVPYAPRSVTAPGAWAHDNNTLMIVSVNSAQRRQATRDITYTVRSDTVDPNPTQFATAMAGTPEQNAAVLSDVPRDVPRSIIELTHRITDGASSDAIKAARIQAYLNDPDRFTYDTHAPGGTGYQVLTNFLFTSRSGYCIHFAAAMALMARIAGIPSRVAVGFLPGTESGGNYVVTTHNAHAWPELYFNGYGWVRFEPTVSIGTAPAWTVESSLHPSTSASASASATDEESAEASDSDTSSASSSASTQISVPADESSTPAGEGTDWWRVLRRVLSALVVACLLAGPMLARLLVRRRRLAPDQPDPQRVDAAWRELRDLARDLGRPWPQGSPAVMAASLAEASSEPAREPLMRLGHWLEVRRYAPQLPSVSDLGADVETVHRQWRAAASGARQVGAVLVPVSTGVLIVDGARKVWAAVQARVGRRPGSPSTSPDSSDSPDSPASPDEAFVPRHGDEASSATPAPDSPDDPHPRHAG